MITVIPAACPQVADTEKPWALWKMAIDASSAAPMPLPPGTTWLALDPELSSPNAVVGVLLPYGGRPIPMTPGRAVAVQALHGSNLVVNVFNGTSSMRGANGVLVGGWYGRAVFVAGGPSDLEPYMAGLQNSPRHPLPKLATIAILELANGAVGVIPTANLTRLRITCLGGTGNALIAQPADFAATITRGIYPYGAAGAGVNLDTGAQIGNDALGAAPTGPEPAGPWYDGTTSLAFTPANQTREITIAPAIEQALKVTALAGTGVTQAILIVEGFRS